MGDGCVPIFMKSQEVPSVSSICWWCLDVLRLCWCASCKSSYLQLAQAVRAKVDDADASSFPLRHFSWPFRLESLLNNFYVVCFFCGPISRKQGFSFGSVEGSDCYSPRRERRSSSHKFVFVLRKCLVWYITYCVFCSAKDWTRVLSHFKLYS